MLDLPGLHNVSDDKIKIIWIKIQDKSLQQRDSGMYHQSVFLEFFF